MLLLKNGQDISGNRIEILIDGESIVSIDESIETPTHCEVVDLNQKYVSSGWIDMHTHCYGRLKLYYDDPDLIGYRTGVTTVVDAGTTGADDIGTFYQDIQEKKTRVLAFINVAHQGIKTQDELSDLANIKESMIQESIDRYNDFIIGIKVRMSASVVGNNGIVPLDMAKDITQRIKLPLMVHIGSNPPLLIDILGRLEAGDIVTHIFNGKANGIFDKHGNIIPEVLDAHRRGVVFDLGHGRDSFSFKVAQSAFNQCLLCDTISTDIYHDNRVDGPVRNMSTTMNKLLKIGYSPRAILDMVTQKPAEVLGLNRFGTLKVGNVSDITIFDLEELDDVLVDSMGHTETLNYGFKPKAVVVKGAYYDIES